MSDVVNNTAEGRRVFSDEFKRNVAGWVIDGGKTLSEAAQEANVSRGAVQMWVKAARGESGEDTPKRKPGRRPKLRLSAAHAGYPQHELEKAEFAELVRLRAEVKTLKAEAETLRSAAVLFARMVPIK